MNSLQLLAAAVEQNPPHPAAQVAAIVVGGLVAIVFIWRCL